MRKTGVQKLRGRVDPRSPARDRRRDQAEQGRPETVLSEDLEYRDGRLAISAKGIDRITQCVIQKMQGGS